MKVESPTAEEVRTALEYNPESGVFIRRGSRYGRCNGRIAGIVIGSGYVVIKINRRMYLAHRLAWLTVYGYWPAAEIDHINGMRHDNRIANLREATRTENARNRKLPRHNTSGHKGVTWDAAANKWKSRVGVGRGVQRSLGYFDKLEDAAAAYAAAAGIHHKEFARIK